MAAARARAPAKEKAGPAAAVPAAPVTPAQSASAPSKKKASSLISPETVLIALVFVALGIMAHHTYEGWKNSLLEVIGDDGNGTSKPTIPGQQQQQRQQQQQQQHHPAQSFTHNFTGDPLTGKGWWGEQTSAMNFCEEDHVVTFAIAEFINTLSNLAYIFFAIATWPKVDDNDPGSGRKWWPIPATNASLFLLGLLSGIYHATLKHYNQIWDESGMYLLVASMDWYLYSYPGAIFSGKVAKPIYTLVLWGACAAVVALNFTASGADFGLHTVLFISLLFGLWPRCLWLINERARLEDQGRLSPNAVPVATIRRRCRIGAVSFLLGFAVWLVDCIYCQELRAFRHQVGLPLAWLTECHGWWHVLTAVGAGVFVQMTNLFCSPTQGNIPYDPNSNDSGNNSSAGGKPAGKTD